MKRYKSKRSSYDIRCAGTWTHQIGTRQDSEGRCDWGRSISSPLALTLNIPAGRFLNQADPGLIKRDIIPIPQLVPDPHPNAKAMRRNPDVAFRPGWWRCAEFPQGYVPNLATQYTDCPLHST